MARTTAVVENGYNIYASPGAVAQHGGKLKIYVCNECGLQVVWVESKKKPGKFYLANVRRGQSGGRFYMGHDLHKCEEEKARLDKYVALIEGSEEE